MVALKTLHTLRLRLEPLEEWHAGALLEGLRDEAVYEFIPEPAPRDVGLPRERYRRWSRRTSPDGREKWLNWAIWSLPSGRYVGWVQSTVREHVADIAYVLFREAWGYGYAREAVAAMIDHLHHAWGASQIRANVRAENRRSIALLGALGFDRAADPARAFRVDPDQLVYRLSFE